MIVNNNLVGGFNQPLWKYESAGNYDIPDMMGKIIQMFQSTNQEFYIFAVWQRLQKPFMNRPSQALPKCGYGSATRATKKVIWTCLVFFTKQFWDLEMYPLAPPGLSAVFCGAVGLRKVSQQGTKTLLDPEDLPTGSIEVSNPWGYPLVITNIAMENGHL
jgi:hypothetical protein